MNFKLIISYVVLFMLSSVAYGQTSTYELPAIIAEYPGGGMASFYDYVNENMIFPEQAIESETVGRVYVQFQTDSLGSVQQESVVVINTCPEVLHEEAIRLIKESGSWIPAKDENGQNLSSKLIIPIIFSMDHLKTAKKRLKQKQN